MEEEQNGEARVYLDSIPGPGKKIYTIQLPNGARDFFLVDEKYEVESILGIGKYGYVLSAEDRSKGDAHPVAIKVFYSIFQDNLDCKRLLREVRILRQITHPFIIRIIDIMEPIEKGGSASLAIVLDKMKSDLSYFLYGDDNGEENGSNRPSNKVDEEGREDMEEDQDDGGDGEEEDHKEVQGREDMEEDKDGEEEDYKEVQGLQSDECKLILNQLLRGIQHLHSAHILHRDLKPQNILVAPNGVVKICDFGLARIEDDRMTRLVVTVLYRAPELLFIDDAVDDDAEDAFDVKSCYGPAIDIWSLGCIFAELLGHDNGEYSALFSNLRENMDISVSLKEIFSVIPKPSDDDPLDFIESDAIRCYIRSALPTMPTRLSMKSVVPNAEPEAVDLLERMLAFDPRKRITAAEALAHPYMADVTVDVLARALELQPAEVEILSNDNAPIVNIREHEIGSANVEQLKKFIYEECESFRAKKFIYEECESFRARRRHST